MRTGLDERHSVDLDVRLDWPSETTLNAAIRGGLAGFALHMEQQP
jgi:hypothetical protein